jgi:plastocyanin
MIGLTAGRRAWRATGVSITNTGFRLSGKTVVAGETVTWTSRDTANHQIVADDKSFITYGGSVLLRGTVAKHAGRPDIARLRLRRQQRRSSLDERRSRSKARAGAPCGPPRLLCFQGALCYSRARM